MIWGGSSNNSEQALEERLDQTIKWSINPFVYNPYEKPHHHYATRSSSPRRPGQLAMMTIQQVHVIEEVDFRKKSLDAHPLSRVEQLGAPKASYAELFYDLFFVASLTSFGIQHEITQAQAIASYVAFFTVLWYAVGVRSAQTRWVWTSQMLYDVRFETADVIHRVFKFLQLIVLGIVSVFTV
jgi:hypothetical protein